MVVEGTSQHLEDKLQVEGRKVVDKQSGEEGGMGRRRVVDKEMAWMDRLRVVDSELNYAKQQEEEEQDKVVVDKQEQEQVLDVDN